MSDDSAFFELLGESKVESKNKISELTKSSRFCQIYEQVQFPEISK